METEFTLKSREDILKELKDLLYWKRRLKDNSNNDTISAFLFILNSNGLPNSITERRLDIIMKEEGLDTETKWKEYWDY